MKIQLHWREVPGGFKTDGRLMLGKWMVGKHYRESNRAHLGRCRATCHLPGRKRNTETATVQNAHAWVENHVRKWFEESGIEGELEFIETR